MYIPYLQMQRLSHSIDFSSNRKQRALLREFPLEHPLMELIWKVTDYETWLLQTIFRSCVTVTCCSDLLVLVFPCWIISVEPVVQLHLYVVIRYKGARNGFPPV